MNLITSRFELLVILKKNVNSLFELIVVSKTNYLFETTIITSRFEFETLVDSNSKKVLILVSSNN